MHPGANAGSNRKLSQKRRLAKAPFAELGQIDRAARFSHHCSLIETDPRNAR